MTRRRAVFGLLIATASVAAADERADVLEIITPLATALSNGDADAFLRRIPADAPERAQLADNVRTLTAQAEMTCSIQLRTFGEGRAELDWYMEIRSRATSTMLERRRQTLAVRIRDKQILSIEPVDFFKPVEVR